MNTYLSFQEKLARFEAIKNLVHQLRDADTLDNMHWILYEQLESAVDELRDEVINSELRKTG